jgi:hypothetical protein
MDSFEKQGLNEDDFGAKGSIVSAFDAFRTKRPSELYTLATYLPTYLLYTHICCCFISIKELDLC